jgi:hypothetical protein
MTTNDTSNDVDALSPSPDTVTLESGLVVRVERLRTRGMFKLLKVVTRGGGPILMQMPLDFNDTEAFVQQFLAVVVMAVPEAEDEAIEFIRAMVAPADFIPDAKSKADKQKNEDLFARLSQELDDPEIGDTFEIITKIIQNEASDIVALGKRLAATLKVQKASLEAKN